MKDSAPLVRIAGIVGLALMAGCWRIGEATQSPALVTWAGYPDTVRVGELFSLEFAGPISLTTCGRLDTATVEVGDSTITLDALRSTYDATCARQRVSFYEARPIRLERAGRHPIRTPQGVALGEILAIDSGAFSPVYTLGEGTLREVAGCWLFGPGWLGNQRVFALAGASEEVREAAGTDRIVHIRGRLRGFTFCGSWGSRPRIRIDTAWVTERTVDDWYP